MFSEKEAIKGFVPGVINRLAHDADYDPEPERSEEVLQSWEAIRSLNIELVSDDILESLENCAQAVLRANQAYSEIASAGIVLDQKSRDEHLLPLLDGLRQFRERAEL